jgi:hypothetical protein
MLKWFCISIFLLAGCTSKDFEGQWVFANGLAKYDFKDNGHYEFLLVNGTTKEGEWRPMDGDKGVLLDDTLTLSLKNDSLTLFDEFFFVKEIGTSGLSMPKDYFVDQKFSMASLEDSSYSMGYFFESDSTYKEQESLGFNKNVKIWSKIEFEGNEFLLLEAGPGISRYLRLKETNEEGHIVLEYYDFYKRKFRNIVLIKI